jgi:hypothetical protein
MVAQMSPQEIDAAVRLYFDEELTLSSVVSHLRDLGYRRSAGTVSANLKAAGYKLRSSNRL